MATVPRFDRYLDNATRWRWRFYAANGRIIADSGYSYETLTDCDHAIAVMKREVPSAPLT